MHGDDGDEWEHFDWNTWGADSANGHTDTADEDGHPSRDAEPGEAQGQWVWSGGIVQWEEPDTAVDRSARAEAESRWAADEVDLPLAAPDALRVRAVRAWLMRQHLREGETMGLLLLERRQSAPEAAQRSGESGEEGPLDLALAERQAAAETYDDLLDALDDFMIHNGPARVLVEFHLWLSERLALLATMPEAPADFDPGILLVQSDAPRVGPPPTARSRAEWRGRADAAVQTRQRVELVTTPEDGE